MFRAFSHCAIGLLCATLAGCGRNAVSSGDAKAAGRPDDGPLVLAVMPELPPYAYIDTSSGSVCGIDIDIVRAAAARLRRPLEIRQMPFSELIPSVRDHKADFAAGAITITEGRSHDVDFSVAYAEEGSSFIYRAGEPMPTMVRAENLRVGAVESMTHDFYLTRHGIDPFRYTSVKLAIEALLAHEIDTVLYDRPALAEAARTSGGKLAVTPLETRENYGIAVRKDRNDFLEAVNAAIRERKAK
ncbi:MAG: amino acid ABC transporter substrate-binding protein [Kiritimatiellae bacterium]|nr:amino acid ABC transporter substrate-binding protein [Kiritimatiellia bacterium]